MLAQFLIQLVCFVGRLEKSHSTGKCLLFQMEKGKHETIELMEPLDEEISGIMEVAGRVKSQGNHHVCILCPV